MQELLREDYMGERRSVEYTDKELVVLDCNTEFIKCTEEESIGFLWEDLEGIEFIATGGKELVGSDIGEDITEEVDSYQLVYLQPMQLFRALNQLPMERSLQGILGSMIRFPVVLAGLDGLGSFLRELPILPRTLLGMEEDTDIIGWAWE